MANIKIPSKIRKAIKERARTESGMRGISLEDVGKSKEKAERKINRRYSKIGQATSKIFGKGKHNVVPMKPGNRMDDKPVDVPTPYKPNLVTQDYGHRTFRSETGEVEGERFNVTGASSDEMEQKVQKKREEQNVKSVGSRAYIRQEGSENFKYNEQQKANYEEDKKRTSKARSESRTSQADTYRKDLKKSNVGKSKRESYVEKKKKGFIDYRLGEQLKKDEAERLAMLGLNTPTKKTSKYRKINKR